MSYPIALASRTSSVLLALTAQAHPFTLNKVRKDRRTLQQPQLHLGSYDDGGLVTATQNLGADGDEPRLTLHTDGARALNWEAYLELRQFGDTVFAHRLRQHIDRDLVEEAGRVQVAWKLGVEAEKTKLDEKRDKAAELFEAATAAWQPKIDPQMRLDLDEEGVDLSADETPEEQFANAVEHGELEEVDPATSPAALDIAANGPQVAQEASATTDPTAGAPESDERAREASQRETEGGPLERINGALKAAGVVKPASKRSGRNGKAPSVAELPADGALATSVADEMAELESIGEVL